MKLVVQAGPDLAIYTTGGVMVAMFTVRLFTGGLDEVDTLIGALHTDALQRPDDPFVGVWSFLLGRSALGQGRVGDAIKRLRDAASLLRARDPGEMRPWTWAALAQALGAADDRAGAQAAIEELLTVRSPAMHHIDIDIELGRAWAACARGERSHAREIAEKIGRSLTEDGRVAVGALALHDALRLGADPAVVVDALEDAAASCDGPIVAAFARHARARAENDLDALLDASGAFESAGWMLHAAECAAGASSIAAAQGLRIRQRDAAVRSAALAKACGPALTPMLESIAGKQALGTLTRREQEIALLAARGMSKREIAETLFRSARTVGNHINHVYGKLGIGSRDELRIALEIGAADAPADT
jgi:DNA-binding CsgD family transcriptional regulator